MPRPPKLDTAAIAAAFGEFDEEREREETLLEQALHDPLPGLPMKCQLLPGGELEDVYPGQWQGVRFVDALTRLPRNCPVIPLGREKDTFFFLDVNGSVAELDAKSSGKGPIGSLFAGRSGFLEWAWPRWSKGTKDNPSTVIGWQADDARQELMNACAFLGHFSMEDQVRGRGAWAALDGSLIFHKGDSVWIDGKWRGLGRHGEHIYSGRKKIGRWSLRKQPASGDDAPGPLLLDLLRSFNWDRGELDARLMLGWVMTARVGGALHRRPVAFVTGAEGSGKSTLQWILRLVMGRALIKSSNTTQAGIYQKLGQDSVAIMVDEMGDKEDGRVAAKILELARICYSGDSMQRGGQDGVGKEFTLNSSFLGSSIAKPATTSQDDSRMAVMMLRERDVAGGKLTVSEPELEGIGAGLLRRWFDWWDRWPELQHRFREALIAAGQDDRACDTFAPLAAACHLALSDDYPTEIDLEMWQAWLGADVLEETKNREKTWRKCLTYLLDAQPEALRPHTFKHKSVGSVLAAFAGGHANRLDVDEHLSICGLAWCYSREDEAFSDYAHGRLFVPTKHPALNALFAGTPWAGQLGSNGPWTVLRQMKKHLYTTGASDKGLDKKRAGTFIDLAKALEA